MHPALQTNPRFFYLALRKTLKMGVRESYLRVGVDRDASPELCRRVRLYLSAGIVFGAL
jgi:hypothetical protein